MVNDPDDPDHAISIHAPLSGVRLNVKQTLNA